MLPILENKTKSIRNLGRVDISVVKELILKIPPQFWEIETKNRNNDFFCFTDTQHILFKFHSSSDDHTAFFEKPIWKIWQPKLQSILDMAVKPYGYANGVIPKAMLAKLSAQKEIDSHIDGGPRNRRIHKIHIPIQSDPNVEFIIQDKSYYLEEGFAYEVNNIVKHRVVNKSDLDRIHLIFEYYNADL